MRRLLDRAVVALGGYTRDDIIDTQRAECRAQGRLRIRAMTAAYEGQARADAADRRYRLCEGFLNSANRRLENAGMISVTTFL